MHFKPTLTLTPISIQTFVRELSTPSALILWVSPEHLALHTDTDWRSTGHLDRIRKTRPAICFTVDPNQVAVVFLTSRAAPHLIPVDKSAMIGTPSTRFECDSYIAPGPQFCLTSPEALLAASAQDRSHGRGRSYLTEGEVDRILRAMNSQETVLPETLAARFPPTIAELN